MIAKNDQAREIKNNQILDYLDKFIEKEREERRIQAAGGTQKVTFEALRESIKMFFNMDSSAFYQDLLTFDSSKDHKIKFSDLIYYLTYSMGELSDAERSVLNQKFRAVGSTLLSIEYVTSMIFHGKANIQTLNTIEKSRVQKIFYSQIRSEMNLKRLSSFDVFQNFLATASHVANESREKINEKDMQAVVDSMKLGMSTDEIEELFRLISDGATAFDYKVFRDKLYGKELEDLTGLIFKLDERLRAKQVTLQEHFYQYGQDKIIFRDFAERMLDIDPTLKYDDMDIMFCAMDNNADLRVSVNEFLMLMTKYSTLNEFKNHLVFYARNKGKELSDILYMTGNTYDGLLKEEFKKLVKDITEGKFTEEDAERLFAILDKDNSRSISKTEMSEILDLAQKQLYNIKEFLMFRNAVIEHCQKNKSSIQEFFKKYAEGSDKLTKGGLNRMINDVVKYRGADKQLIQAVLDSNMSDTIDLKEFKTAIIGPDVEVDILIINIRRMMANTNLNVDEIFNNFDQDRRGTLDFFEFTNFLTKLNLRLTFVEVEKLFDVLAFTDSEHIKKSEFFQAFSADPSNSSSESIVKVINDFKLKVGYL